MLVAGEAGADAPGFAAAAVVRAASTDSLGADAAVLFLLAQPSRRPSSCGK